MKNFSMLLLATVLVTGASCKKNRTCECDDSSGTAVNTFTIDDTRSGAKKTCALYNSTGVTCTLK